MRRVGRPWLLGLAITAALFLLGAGLLLSCDPALAQVREGNWVLYALVVLFFIGVVWSTFRKRPPLP